jgi:hypothetical protein
MTSPAEIRKEENVELRKCHVWIFEVPQNFDGVGQMEEYPLWVTK